MKKLFTFLFIFTFIFAQDNITLKKLTNPLFSSTLIISNQNLKNDNAILYIHGYNDYFFNFEMMDKIVENGYDFYAIDLHGYGRSKKFDKSDYYMDDVSDYFDEIHQAIDIIRQNGAKKVTVLAHSQGGLIATLYADMYKDVDLLILNSPFFSFNAKWYEEDILIPLISFLGVYFPKYQIEDYRVSKYGKNLHTIYDFDEKLKMTTNPPKHFGWIRAISKAHESLKLQKQLDIPVLLFYSSKSGDEDKNEDLNTSDVILDVKEIKETGASISKDVTQVEVKDGMHDIFLSKQEARQTAYKKMFEWLQKKSGYLTQSKK